MKIILNDNTELSPMNITGKTMAVQGEIRDCLVFEFLPSEGIENIHTAFSSANCENIRIVEDNGMEHIHTGYVIRVELALTSAAEEGQKEQIIVIMAQRSYAEQQLLDIQKQMEETSLQMTDTQLALCEVYEMLLNNGKPGEVESNG